MLAGNPLLGLRFRAWGDKMVIGNGIGIWKNGLRQSYPPKLWHLWCALEHRIAPAVVAIALYSLCPKGVVRTAPARPTHHARVVRPGIAYIQKTSSPINYYPAPI